LSSLDDPRVLFAAERTLMAWSRTTAGLMAFGFLIDRSVVFAGEPIVRGPAFWIGAGFVLLGVLLDVAAIIQFRRSVAALRPQEIPPGYWVNLSAYAGAAIGLLGCALIAYMSLA
jgi:putative membrane protein